MKDEVGEGKGRVKGSIIYPNSIESDSLLQGCEGWDWIIGSLAKRGGSVCVEFSV